MESFDLSSAPYQFSHLVHVLAGKIVENDYDFLYISDLCSCPNDLLKSIY